MLTWCPPLRAGRLAGTNATPGGARRIRAGPVAPLPHRCGARPSGRPRARASSLLGVEHAGGRSLLFPEGADARERGVALEISRAGQEPQGEAAVTRGPLSAPWRRAPVGQGGQPLGRQRLRIELSLPDGVAESVRPPTAPLGRPVRRTASGSRPPPCPWRSRRRACRPRRSWRTPRLETETARQLLGGRRFGQASPRRRHCLGELDIVRAVARSTSSLSQIAGGGQQISA